MVLDKKGHRLSGTIVNYRVWNAIITRVPDSTTSMMLQLEIDKHTY